MNHRIGRALFAGAVGLTAAVLAYRIATDPSTRLEREQEERVVIRSRVVLAEALALDDPEIVDALAPERQVGKTYIYPQDGGWQVSGFYRRDRYDEWHPYLLTLDGALSLVHLKVADSDPRLLARAAADPRLEALPDESVR